MTSFDRCTAFVQIYTSFPLFSSTLSNSALNEASPASRKSASKTLGGATIASVATNRVTSKFTSIDCLRIIRTRASSTATNSPPPASASVLGSPCR